MSYGVATQTGVSVAIQSIPSMSANKGLRNGYGATFAENFADGTNVLDPRITFSRASNATVTNSSGNIVYAPHNLLTYSEQFDNASWTKTTTTVAANSFVAPSGNTTADTLTASGANSTTLQTYTAIASPYTFSVYLYRKTGTGNIDITVDGTTWVTKTITAGWTRVETTLTPTAGSKTAGIRIATNGDAVYAWGAQLNVGSLQPYYPTTVKNLLGYSEAFDNAAWTKTNASVTANTTATAAPDGTFTADKLVEDTANATHLVYAGTSTLTANTDYTVSVYLKAAERTNAVIGSVTGGLGTGVNLATGTLTDVAGIPGWITATNRSITSVGNGWYRVSVTIPNATGGNSLFDALRIFTSNGTTGTYTGNGTSGIYIWGAQLSDSASLDTYVNNPVAAPTAAAYYGARFDYDPVTLQPRGLLIEEQRTNLVLRSEELNVAPWALQNTTVSANATTSPDGTVDADKLIEDTATSTHYIANGFTPVNATTYTASVYLKAVERNFAFVGFSGGSMATTFVSVNLSTGAITTAVGTPVSSSSTAVGNGWYRVTISLTSTGTTASNLDIRISTDGLWANRSYTGNGTSGIFVWGAQVEAGAFATSYIPTVASQVTRSADTALIQGSNFSGWYNQSEGTLSISALRPSSLTGNRTPLAVTDGGFSERITIRTDSATTGTNFVSTASGVQATFFFSNIVSNTLFKTAITYQVNSVNASMNGVLGTADTSANIPTVNSMSIGSVLNAEVFNGYIRQLAYYPRRLSNSELQAITQ